jgi:hypothetical protein
MCICSFPAGDAGISTDRIVAFDLALTSPRYKEDAATVTFFHDLYARVRTEPDVESAGLTSHLPMFNFGMIGAFLIDGKTP